MIICVFDTETTSLNKPFAYNIGYIIADTDTGVILIKRDYVVEQIWHNAPLFSSAYYAEKRNIYISRMRARQAIMDKFGYICQQMARDFRNFNVEIAFAYNSDFDERVFNFNCDWYKCINPFDNIPIKDIRAFAFKYLFTDSYKEFCDEHNLYTDNGNYSTTAESAFRYISGNTDFCEEHTALADSRIEFDILLLCVKNGADYNEELTAPKALIKRVVRVFKVKRDRDTVYSEECESIVYSKKYNTVYLK